MMVEWRAIMAGDAASAERFRVFASGAEEDAGRVFGRVKVRVHQMQSEIENHQENQEHRQASLEFPLLDLTPSENQIHTRCDGSYLRLFGP